MQRIYPITKQTCTAHYGRPVLIFLNDGSEIYGILSRVERGQLILNDFSAGMTGSSKIKTKGKAPKATTKQKKAAAQAWGPFGSPYGYGPNVSPSCGFPLFGGFGCGNAQTVKLANAAVMFALPG